MALKAQVHTIGGFSAHGDRDDLLAWAGNFETNPLFFVTHGEPKASQALSVSLQERGMRSIVPGVGQEFLVEPDVPVRRVSAAASPSRMPSVLDDIELLLRRLRQDKGTLEESEETRHLLLSARTLLEAAERGGRGL